MDSSDTADGTHGSLVDFTLDETARDLRDLVAGLLGREATPARLQAHEAGGAPYDAGLWRSLAGAGVLGACLPEVAGGAGLGPGWPKRYGGGGYGPLEQQIFANEIARAEVPYPVVTVQTVAPTLTRYGTAAQKAFFLPRILAGECHFAIGYSEPEAGTDLASPRTTAVRADDHYVVNGQKIFTTGAHHAQYVWPPVPTPRPTGTGASR